MRTTALDFLCSKPCYHTCDRLISALCLIYVGMIILAWINNLCINRDHFPQSRFPSYTTSLSCLWHIHMDIIAYLCWYACDNYTRTLAVKYRDNLSHSRFIIMPVQTFILPDNEFSSAVLDVHTVPPTVN